MKPEELVLKVKKDEFLLKVVNFTVILLKVRVAHLTLKMPRKPASENVFCLCRLLNIIAKISNLFLHKGRQCGP